MATATSTRAFILGLTGGWRRRALTLLCMIGLGVVRIAWDYLGHGSQASDSVTIAVTAASQHKRDDRAPPAAVAAERVAPTSIALPARGPALVPFDLVRAFPRLAFECPVDIRQPPGDPRKRVFVLEHTGRLYSFDSASQVESKSLFLDISAQVHRQVESGAMGMAFHPEFGQAESPQRGFFYVFYVLKGEKSLIDRLSRFEVPDGRETADPHSEVVLIEQEDEQMFHNGGCLHFGPDDYLYVSVGDEGGALDQYHNSQRIDGDLFSGILRIDVDCAGGDRSHPILRQPATGHTQNYYVPHDNPFAGEPGALEEFWSLGLRAPHRFSFDRVSGEIWCGDVGQSRWEEINRIERGGNYQWCYREGTRQAEGAWLAEKPARLVGSEKEPVYAYPHADGNGGIIGGYIYRGRQYPELTGKYIFGDCNSGRIWALEVAAPAPEPHLLALIPADQQLTSFGEDSDGELFICVQARRVFLGNRAAILRLQRGAQQVAELPRRLSETGIFRDLRTLEPMPGVREYEINVPFWSDNAEKRRWISVPGDGRSPDPHTDRILFRKSDYWSFPPGTVFIKHFELPLDESDPSHRRRLETRLLVRDSEAGVYGITYKWLPDESDAELLDEAFDEEISIDTSDGNDRKQVWHYPSREDCVVCHNAMAGYVLGVRTEQLNRLVYDSRGGHAVHQLRAWQETGLLNLVNEKIRELDPAYLATLARYAPTREPTAGLERRARSYLAANCSYCHQEFWRLNFRLDADFQWLMEASVRDDLGVRGARIIKRGLPEQSALLLRIRTSHTAHRMPPLGRNLSDAVGAELVEKWIAQMGEAAERGDERRASP